METTLPEYLNQRPERSQLYHFIVGKSLWQIYHILTPISSSKNKNLPEHDNQSNHGMITQLIICRAGESSEHNGMEAKVWLIVNLSSAVSGQYTLAIIQTVAHKEKEWNQFYSLPSMN